MDGHTINLIGQTFSISTLALLLMLVGILLPSVNYSIRLKNPTPAQLLIAVCIALFSSVVFLWILDATSILKFQSECISKSIYGAAISSVLGTSVAVYKDAFKTRKYTFEGAWRFSLEVLNDDNNLIIDYIVVLTYSTSAEMYWGYSEFVPTEGYSNRPAVIEVKEFLPDKNRIVCVLRFHNVKKSIKYELNMSDSDRRFESKRNTEDDEYSISISRDRFGE